MLINGASARPMLLPCYYSACGRFDFRSAQWF